LACTDAGDEAGSSASGRFLPLWSREAPGSSALLPERGKHGSLSTAPWCWSMAETARANGWASPVKAWPVSCGCSTRARDGWAAGGSLRHKTAAADKAHVSWAWPIVAPDVPTRVPADALAHG